jgi:hypothetical protein
MRRVVYSGLFLAGTTTVILHIEVGVIREGIEVVLLTITEVAAVLQVTMVRDLQVERRGCAGSSLSSTTTQQQCRPIQTLARKNYLSLKEII